jgi:hypothetical protein
MPKKYRIDVKPVKDKIVKKRGGRPFVPQDLILKESKRYILITDIGRDIDDTLALIALLYYHKHNTLALETIVVSGSNLQERAKCVHYWLMKFDIDNIPVICNIDEDYNMTDINDTCVLPYDDTETANVQTYYDTNKKMLTKYGTLLEYFKDDTIDTFMDLNILCIGPVTPLYNAIMSEHETLVLSKIRQVYFQGNAYIDRESIIPDTRPPIGAYNFAFGKDERFENMKTESENVIRKCIENDKTLYFLGKNAAYLIKFTYTELMKINKPMAINAGKKTFDFAKRNPDFPRVFAEDIINDELLKIHLNKDDLTMDDFYSNLRKLSNPYDLVLIYLALFPEMFNEKKSRFYNEDYCIITKNIADKKIKAYEFPNSIDISKHIHFNDNDPEIFTIPVENVKTHMLFLLDTALQYTKYIASAVTVANTETVANEPVSEESKGGGSRKRRPSTNKKPSKKPVTKTPKKASSKKSPKHS